MHFRVLEGQEPRPVELAFGRTADLPMLREWRLPPRIRRHEPAGDAVEFARLAAKRWRYHPRTGHIVTTLAELREASARGSREELAFLLLARAGWHHQSSILGLAHCRRTWCGHIFLDFLSVHPRIVARQAPHIRGVGAGILYGLCAVAGASGVPMVWGETTESSVTFYRRALGGASLLDWLAISGPLLEHCQREFRRIEVLPS